MKRIKLDFCDFWPGFRKNDNYFVKLLSTQYRIELAENPDFLIYSVFGKNHRSYNCVKILFVGENERPNFRECDYAFSFDYSDNPRHYRLPLYALYVEPNDLIKQNMDIDRISEAKSKFCNFVYSDSKADPIRERFFRKLSSYKQVDSGGRFLNNIGKRLGKSVEDKLKFINQYKFTIAFENSSYPGYTTEKIVHPMLMSSIPIYWGNERIGKDFNPKSFLNYHDYNNEDAFIEQIIKVDQDEKLYGSYLVEPYYHHNRVNAFIKPENVLKQFAKIFGS